MSVRIFSRKMWHERCQPVSRRVVFQLLDCFVIPVLMVLSWFFLKTRYRLVHFVAVSVCLLGVGAMVGADILAERDQGSSKDTLPSFTSVKCVSAVIG